MSSQWEESLKYTYEGHLETTPVEQQLLHRADE